MRRYYVILLSCNFFLMLCRDTIVHAPIQLSSETYTQLVNSIQEDTPLEKIHQIYPWIHNIKSKKTPHKMIITLFIEKPLYALDNEWYVTTQGHIYKHSVLKKEVYEKLPRITLGRIHKCSTTLAKQLISIPSSLLEAYNVIFYNPYHIVLQNKNKTTWPIITSLEQLINTQIHDYCNYIHKKFYEIYTKKKKKKYALDIRFKKQIVLRQEDDTFLK